MAAVINSTTALWRFVYRAEELPLTGSHFGACCGRTWGIVEQESDNEIVALVYEEAAEFVKPERTINTFRLCRDEDGCLAGDGDRIFAIGGLGIVVMQSFEMLLELKGRVELRKG